MIGTTNQPSPSSQYFLDGRLDEVRLYDHALTASAISDLRDDTSPPIAHWKLDETSGTIIDSTGNGYNGTATGSPTYGVDGVEGTAIDFDGSNDYFNLGTNINSLHATGTNNFTTCVWFNTISSSSQVNALLGNHVNSYPWNGYLFELRYGTPRITLVSTTNAENLVEGNITQNDGKWHQLVLSYGQTNGLKVHVDRDLIIDDVYQGSIGRPGVTRYGFIGDGSEATSFNGVRNQHYFEGGLDNVVLLDNELTDTNVYNFFSNGYSAVSDVSMPGASLGLLSLGLLVGFRRKK